MTEQTPVPEAYVARLATIALALPGVQQEEAWRGVRWRVRQQTFAHVLVVEDGRPGAYAEALGRDEPTVALIVRLPSDEHDALVASGSRYFAARPGRQVAGVVIDDEVDWVEVAELVTESFRLLAPPTLRDLVD